MREMSAPVNEIPEPTLATSTAMMTFAQHLGELRRRILYCAGTFAVTSTSAFFYTAPIIRFLQNLAPSHTVFVQLAPGEVFMASFKLSMIAGLGLALPVILFHLFQFVSPGLQQKEKRYVLPLILAGLVMFLLGAAFGAWGVLPPMLRFFLSFGQDVAHNQMSIAAYVDFCTGFLFATGLVFQLPLFLLFLSFLNLVTSKKLLGMWRIAIVGAFIIGALVTPSVDAGSQIIMSASMIALYGFSIMLIKLFGR